MESNPIRIGLGFVFSILMVMLSGWTKSFNVISVDMKNAFNFTMTEVQILASSTMGGWLFNFLGVYVMNGLHFRRCYIIASLMVASSTIVLIFAVNFVEYFKTQVVVLAIATCTASCGYVTAYLPSVTWGLHHSSKQHGGKIIAFYLAARTIGKVYFSAVFDVWFSKESNLYLYFVSQLIVFLVVSLGCFVLHSTPKPNTETITTSDELLGDKPVVVEETEISRKKLMKMVFFQSVAISGSMFSSISTSYVNNVTNIAEAIGLYSPQSTIYVVSVGLLVGRIGWGFMLDRTKSDISVIGLTLISYVIYTIGNIIGFWRLDSVTIYVITTLVGIGSGSAISMATGTLNKTYGIKAFPFISAYTNLLVCFLTVMIQMTMGLVYDWSNVHKIPFCLECFFGSLLILIICIFICFVIQILNLIYIFICKQSGR